MSTILRVSSAVHAVPADHDERHARARRQQRNPRHLFAVTSAEPEYIGWIEGISAQTGYLEKRLASSFCVCFSFRPPTSSCAGDDNDDDDDDDDDDVDDDDDDADDDYDDGDDDDDDDKNDKDDDDSYGDE